MEENGIIQKLEHPDSKAKVLYVLTEKGIDLLPLLIEIQFWFEKHLTVYDEIKGFTKEAKKDREKFIKTLSKKL